MQTVIECLSVLAIYRSLYNFWFVIQHGEEHGVYASRRNRSILCFHAVFNTLVVICFVWRSVVMIISPDSKWLNVSVKVIGYLVVIIQLSIVMVLDKVGSNSKRVESYLIETLGDETSDSDSETQDVSNALNQSDVSVSL